MKPYNFNKTELDFLKSDGDKMFGVLSRISSYIFARLGKEFYIEDVHMDADFDEDCVLNIVYHAPIMMFVHVHAMDLEKWTWKEKIDAQLEKLYGDSLVEVEYPEAVDFTMDIAVRDVSFNERISEIKSAIWDFILNGEDELYDELCFAFQVENIELGDCRVCDGTELGVEVLSDLGYELVWIYIPLQTLEDGSWDNYLVNTVENIVDESYKI